MNKKILLLATGGTIASGKTAEGLAPAMSGDAIFEIAGSVTKGYDITTRDILQLDSSNIQPEEWQLIAGHIAKEVYHYDGIVITHGTDTMAYTSSMLSFMLRGLPIPIVLTGSQLPLNHPFTDGVENLRTAFAMAARGVPGVFLAFDRKVILGVRAVKVRTIGFHAFESVNSPYVAMMDSTGLHINPIGIPPQEKEFFFDGTLCKNVFLIKLTPGFDPRIFDMLLDMHYKGIVIEAFGAGGLHFIRRDLISKLQTMADAGISVLVCSQCLYESSNFSLYQTGRKALKQGVLQGYDMTTEAAVTKLMWVLGHTNNKEEIARAFQTNLGGEVTIGAQTMD